MQASSRNTFDNYNQMLDEHIKGRLNLVQNGGHPCTRKGLCTKGSKCPFIGLPNDTCLFHLTDECRYGEKCQNTHYPRYAKIYQDAKEEFKKKRTIDYSNIAEEIEMDKEWLEENTRLCPTCVVPVEKIDGCPSMSCSKCGTKFNWEQMAGATGATNLHKFQRAGKEAATLRRQPTYRSEIDVIVIGLSGKRHVITLSSNAAQVTELMEQIERLTNIPVGQQRLQSKGKTLEKERSITEYGIKQGNIINLVLRLPGGSG